MYQHMTVIRKRAVGLGLTQILNGAWGMSNSIP